MTFVVSKTNFPNVPSVVKMVSDCYGISTYTDWEDLLLSVLYLPDGGSFDYSMVVDTFVNMTQQNIHDSMVDS